MTAISKQLSDYMRKIAARGGSANTDAQAKARTANAAKARKAKAKRNGGKSAGKG